MFVCGSGDFRLQHKKARANFSSQFYVHINVKLFVYKTVDLRKNIKKTAGDFW